MFLANIQYRKHDIWRMTLSQSQIPTRNITQISKNSTRTTTQNPSGNHTTSILRHVYLQRRPHSQDPLSASEYLPIWSVLPDPCGTEDVISTANALMKSSLKIVANEDKLYQWYDEWYE